MTAERKKMSPVAFGLNVLMSALFFPAVTLLLAGNWRWVEGWIFALWFVVMILFNIIYSSWIAGTDDNYNAAASQSIFAP